jgi:hypothetical protein
MFEFVEFQIPGNEVETREIRSPDDVGQLPRFVIADGTIKCLIFTWSAP